MAVQVAPENVVGRDKLIERIWSRLNKNSLRFTAERRIGKTTVMLKMAAEPMPGYEVLFLELEGIDSPDRFTELLLNRIKPLLSKKDTAKLWWEGFWSAAGGTEIGGTIKLPDRSPMGWQTTLQKMFEGLCEHQSGTKILLLMDEIPYMLQKIASASSEQKTLALTLLDTLRSIRQLHPNLRMVFAGSVGLHHVISDLKQAGLASEPVNDMPAIEIHALRESDALILAARLVEEEQIQIAGDRDSILQRLVVLTDAVPFYLENVCTRLGEMEHPISVEDVEKTVRHQLTTALDPWEMEHFRDRLSIYFSGSVVAADGKEIPKAKIATKLLDALSSVSSPRSIEEIWQAVKAQYALTDRQCVVDLLRSLALDHYLISDADKRYSFRFPLIKNWWKLAQGLAG